VDAALDARALEAKLNRHVRGSLDFLRNVLRALAALNLDRAYAGNELLRDGQPALDHVRDDDRLRAGRACAEERHEADRASAGDEHWVAETKPGALDAGKRDGQGLAECCLLERDRVREPVQPRGGVEMPAGESAVEGRGAEEDDIGASYVQRALVSRVNDASKTRTIVTSSTARLARRLGAGHTSLDRHAITSLPLGDPWANFDNLSTGLVARATL
jgi:hypothetical protein